MRYFNHISIFFGAVFFAFAASASGSPPPVVYGVCNCQSKEKTTPLIELSLLNDGTFSYIDNSNSTSKVKLSGTYSVKGSKLYLVSSDGNKSFHSQWKYNKERTCIKSRYKFNFRRVCATKS